MGKYDKLLTPYTLKHLRLKNRIMSTAHAPAYGVDGMPMEQYQRYHEEKARGGISLTMFGGSSTISPDCPPSFGQLSVGEERIVPYFQEFAGRIHGYGAALMCQITHMGRRTRWDSGDWLPPVSASVVREPEHRTFPKQMEAWDIERIIHDYAQAALHCKWGELDGVEISGTGPHLISQFLSPRTNQRGDEYGGSFENRIRFCMEVLQAVREAVGHEFIVGIRISADHMLKNGMSAEECLAFSVRLSESGLVDFLNISPASEENLIGLCHSIPNMKYPVAPFLHLAVAIRHQLSTSGVDMPIIHANRIPDLDTAAQIVADGHLDIIAMTRAHMADPHIVRKLQAGTPHRIRKCIGDNYCLDRIYHGNQALCIQNAATGREITMPHVIEKVETGLKIVVIGGGPSGLEAARVSASRGHEVLLFEAQAKTGGQVNIAAKVTWRKPLQGITEWLDNEVRLLGVQVRTNCNATLEMIMAESPDVVIVATGGRPHTGRGRFEGHELAVSSWDIINERVPIGQNVLLFDDSSGHPGLSCAEFMAERGAKVELVTPDQSPGQELGGTSFATHMKQLYLLKVKISPNLHLTKLHREGEQLIALLENEYSHLEESRVIDQLVYEHATLPNDDLYFALKPHATNLGEVDIAALLAGQPQQTNRNPAGKFRLFRLGDAVTSRNIHAAIYDSLRLCSRL